MTIATASSGRWLAVICAALSLAAPQAFAQPGHGGGAAPSGGGHSGAAAAGAPHGGASRGGAPRSGGYTGAGHAARGSYGGYGGYGAAVRGWHAQPGAHPVGQFAPAAHVGHGNYYRPRGAPGGGRWGHARGGGWWPWWSTGLFVAALPLYYNSFWWDGVPYYYGDNAYYVWNRDVSQYEVVPPPQAEDPAAAGAAAPEELFAYPSEGQSNEQLVQDREECRRWAAGQARADAGAMRRAEAACLEGRGYSVQ